MSIRPFLLWIPLLVCTLSPLAAQKVLPSEVDVVDEVNPLIGTAAEGQTFPAVGVPSAMTDWTPQTRDSETKCIAPYYSADTRIQGFRGSHFLSGSCTQDYGSFTIMPESGPLKLTATARASAFRHTDEIIHPHLYSVDLRDSGIHAEMTGTARSGFMSFRFSRSGKSWIVIQTNTRTGLAGSAIHVDKAKNEVSGQNAAYRLYAGSGKPAGFSGYFVIHFDHSFEQGGVWNEGGEQAGKQSLEGGKGPTGAFLGFSLHPNETVKVRIGTSFTSVDAARRNLEEEIPDWDFAQTVAATRQTWNQALGRIRITGRAPERRVFYTALYHSLLLPRIFSDRAGTYPRFAGGQSIETAKGFTYYDDFSLWDTFRALHPLLTILDPDREGDMLASFVTKGTQGGFMPIFPAWNSYTSEMVGDHAAAIFLDGYRKGIRGFDMAEAYRLIRRNAFEHPSEADYIDGRGRRALTSYLKYGYVPLEDHVPYAFHKDEQVSRTLEYAYDDFLAGQMATELGHKADAALLDARGNNWKNVIDSETGFARGRHADGSWIKPFNPEAPASFITEGLPIQYTFFVPQNIPGLVERLHGPKAFEARLDTLFAKNLYDQGNEPSHHVAFLYNKAGVAWKTQQHVRAILDEKYTNRVDGLPGNDDAGQMSAWYVLSAIGLYPVTPGIPEYEISTPRFDDTTILLPTGKRLHILAPGTESGARYIQSVSLNGQPLKGHTLSHAALIAGGELRFTLSQTPVPAWPLATPQPVK